MNKLQICIIKVQISSNKFFITYKNGTVINGTDQKSEHMASFKYGYRIETVRDWLFEQIKY